jgi:hypothetical protein
MKLAITQIVLGVLIVLAACYISWWMIFGVVSLLNETVVDGSGAVVTNASPDNETLFVIARYVSGLLFGLGLVVLITGAFWKKIKSKKNPAIIQVIAGTLIAAISVFILLWGYAFDFIVAIEGGIILVQARTVWINILTALLGLAVLGTGIAQFVKARKKQI